MLNFHPNLRGKNKKFLFGILAFCVGFTVYIRERVVFSPLTHVVQPNVCEVYDNQMPRIFPFKCVRTTKIPNINRTYVMCIKPLEVDKHISGMFNREGMWEPNEVKLIIDLTQKYPGGTFLDLGANIGTFSAAVAASQYKVVAVDPIWTNLAYLHQSSFLSGTNQFIRYIRNTVSDEFTRLYPYNMEPDNEGGLVFVTENETEKISVDQLGDPIDSTTFEDILRHIGSGPVILKIDIEGFECKALFNFLKTPEKVLFVPYIFMEWFQIEKNHGGKCPNLLLFVQAFRDSGYIPYSPGKHDTPLKFRIEDESVSTREQNVLWIHKDAVLNDAKQ